MSTSNLTMANNVVSKGTLRYIQRNVLENLSDILYPSFGPMGSNTVLKKENAFNVYSKDGHTILKNIYYHGIIEQSIKDDVESITRHIVKTVGDGTTSAVMMANEIFKAYIDMEDRTNLPPQTLINLFNVVIKEITDAIKFNARTCTLDDIYDICMISTNGNKEMSRLISDIYEAHRDAFIDVSASIDENTTIKEFDGMTINTGINNSAYVTDTIKNEAVIDHPRIYFFKDPVDTREMAALLDAIISLNIIHPLNEGKQNDLIPTVIIAPKISRDLSATLGKITDFMGNQVPANRLPFLVITDYHQEYEVEDICYMCGDKPAIHKYIDPDIMKDDIEKGLAPTPETIQDFCGYCDQVVSSSFKTSFINPSLLKDSNGEYTTKYNNLITFLETELSRARQDGEDDRFIGTLKRRINSLKSNLVEIMVGGISPSDRDALRDLVEDAVLNCRSARKNGVGYGANFMGLKASFEALDSYIKLNEEYKKNPDMTKSDTFDIKHAIASCIYHAFFTVSYELYMSIANTDKEINDIVNKSIKENCPMNLRTKEFDHRVKSSIESDIIVLETVGKLIGLMATSNQFIVPSPAHNVYEDPIDYNRDDE